MLYEKRKIKFKKKLHNNTWTVLLSFYTTFGIKGVLEIETWIQTFSPLFLI